MLQEKGGRCLLHPHGGWSSSGDPGTFSVGLESGVTNRAVVIRLLQEKSAPAALCWRDGGGGGERCQTL